MRVPRALLDCFVFMAGTTLVFAEKAESPADLVLGPAVLISSNVQDLEMVLITFAEPELGPVVPIASSSEGVAESSAPSPLKFSREEIQYLPGVEASPNPYFGRVPVRVIGHGRAAPIEVQTACRPSAEEGVCHPDQIQLHFSTLADQLAAAGLADEAQQIQELQKTFQDEHYQRLLLAFKEAQLKKLQAEIDGLRQEELNRSQISLRLQVIELNPQGRQAVVGKLQEFFSSPAITGAEKSPEFKWGCWELTSEKLEDFTKLIVELSLDGTAKIVAEPSATVLSGRNVRFLTGGEIAVRAANDGQNGNDNSSVSFIGTGLLANPRIIGGNKIRLGLIFDEVKNDPIEIDAAIISEKRPITRRLETLTEVTSGQSVVLVTPPNDNNADDQSKQSPKVLFLITPEIVIAPRQTQNSVASPAIYAPRPASREAKFIKKASSTRD